MNTFPSVDWRQRRGPTSQLERFAQRGFAKVPWPSLFCRCKVEQTRGAVEGRARRREVWYEPKCLWRLLDTHPTCMGQGISLRHMLLMFIVLCSTTGQSKSSPSVRMQKWSSRNTMAHGSKPKRYGTSKMCDALCYQCVCV